MYEERVERLLAAMNARGADAVLIASRENRIFLSGFTGDTGAILITEKGRTLFVEPRYALQAAMETRDFNIVSTTGGLYNSINDTIINDGVKRIIYEDRYFTVNQFRSLEKRLRYEELIPAGDVMLRLRAVKDSSEISALTEAARITDEGMARVEQLLRVGVTEKELALKAEMHLRSLDAEGFAFPPVIVSGVRTAMPSANPAPKEVAFGDIVVVNMGIIYKGYCTDCSRTYFMGSADEGARNMYGAVLAARSEVLAEARTGNPCRNVDAKARAVLNERGYGDGYLHCVGHGVGLSNRELPIISLQSSDTLCTNMTVSAGVGAYKGGYGGIRITDTAVVTPDGAVCLTKTPDELKVM